MNQRIESFVNKQIKYRNLNQQAILVSLASIVFAFNMLTVYLSLGESRPKYGGVALVLVFIFLLIPFLLWLVFTLSFYFTGLLFGARMQFSILLRAVGYGMAPFIGSGLAWGVGRYIALRGAQACQLQAFNCEPGVSVELQQQVNALMTLYSSVTSSIVFQALYVVGVGMVLIAGYYWIIALKESTTLTREGAALTVGLTVVSFLVIVTQLTF